MLNFSFGPNVFLGIIVSFGVLILYFLRNVKPEVAIIPKKILGPKLKFSIRYLISQFYNKDSN